MTFDLTILGSNSAVPIPQRFSSAQVVNFREKLFLLDCGEGTQIQLRKYRQKFSRLNHIFITHLHGDHCFGLPGLISTLNLLGRRSKLHIYAHADLEKMLTPFLDYFMHQSLFEIVYHHLDPAEHKLIYEDKGLEVYSIPLKHSAPTCGFLFKEKAKDLNLKKEMIQAFSLSVKDILAVKRGEDFVTEDGEVVANERLAHPAKAPRSYAYITDTAFKPNIAPWIQDVDVLYHEATFADEKTLKTSKTLHSTAGQAAQMAQMVNAKKLLVGHYSSRYTDISVIEDAAKEIFENTTAVKDGLTISI